MTVIHSEINSELEEDLANNMELPNKNSYASKELGSAKTNIETLSSKIA